MSKVIVLPIGTDGGFSITEDGNCIAKFADSKIAMVHHVDTLLALRKLRDVIEDHACFLHSRTPYQADVMGACDLRDLATQLREDANLVFPPAN